MLSDRELILSVDWGQKWPLSDIMWWAEEQPNWDELITPEMKQRLYDWAAFFNAHARLHSTSLGSEENRRWFELEGSALFNELADILEGKYRLRLQFWY